MIADFLPMAAVQFVSYLNLTINFRALAHGQVAFAVATDIIASAIGYFIVRKVAKSEGTGVLLGMMVGGGLSSALGIWLTRTWGG